jgi:PilZ domain-containing protein
MKTQHSRQFIRHPVTVPIEVDRVRHDSARHPLHAHSVGVGGVAFRCDDRLEPGTVVRLRIACVEPQFDSDARVVWCNCNEIGCELGVEFLSADDAFRARMVEQICHIENYRQSVFRAVGRLPSPEEAASEWVSRFAAHFPNHDPE